MYKFLKWAYFRIPLKKFIFQFIRTFYRPPSKMAGYLKFNGTFELELPGSKRVKIYNDNSTLPTVLFWEGINGYEPCSLLIWCELSKQAKYAFDLGANFGLFGLAAKKMNEKLQVRMFEPIVRNADRIKKNFQLNDLECIVETVAVSDYDGFINFYDMDSTENTIGSISRSFVEAHKHHTQIIPIVVPVIALDSYVKKNNITELDLLKIDVEGSDYEVLLGFKETMSTLKPDILIEITSGESGRQINALLEGLPIKYYLYELNDNLGVTPQKTIERGASRNYLLTTKDIRELIHKVPNMVYSQIG